ncbi:glycosyltransferase family 2 protein [Flavimaricola marinus]|uniref:N-acetylglucosaminyl-diphospho-decaprenol L-rhamnosyltransferase n=1 Tax=Flavimaricola marinus TaxID=1819565 RepID=A0A238LIS0_9RHOB|nr:glycosyltransferase family 2 protein [Flavimaricola marinus]SMY09295.1 N-acetylglucosaminyl-diphospho-decaprenol L-rhamnosyltransferase [Flavimaricola marinus]
MIGVIIVTFQSADVIAACLESLRTSTQPDLHVVVCDNASDDGTLEVIRNWADANNVALAELSPDGPPVSTGFSILSTGGNLGFAGAVNAGLKRLLAVPDLDLFWVLNPDSEALPDTASAFARKAREAGPFALMGGRIRYHEAPGHIQSDGGVVFPWSGICKNLNSGLLPESAVLPDAETLDFISGASLVASRRFVEQAGLMVEDYFLYYEEVDWAARRGDLPLILCPEAEVLHHGGTTIGTGAMNRRPSPFANYFNYRNRMRFVRRFRPLALPTTWFLSMLRVAKLMLLGAMDEAAAAARGLNGLPPPAAVRDRIAPGDRFRAFGTGKRPS